MYKGKWSPEIGERLLCQKDLREEAREHDVHAIGVYKKNRETWPGEVGHVPIELLKLMSQFLECEIKNFIKFQVNGKRFRENGLVVPGTYSCYSKNNKIAQIFFDELFKKKNIYSHITLDIVSDKVRKYPVFKS